MTSTPGAFWSHYWKPRVLTKEKVLKSLQPSLLSELRKKMHLIVGPKITTHRALKGQPTVQTIFGHSFYRSVGHVKLNYRGFWLRQLKAQRDTFYFVGREALSTYRFYDAAEKEL